MTGDNYWTPRRRHALAVLVAVLVTGTLVLLGWPGWLAVMAGTAISLVVW